MKYALSLMVAVSALGTFPAGADEIEYGESLASLNNHGTVGSVVNDRPDGDRNMALIKEGESESPDMIAAIESNREDRERMVVMAREAGGGFSERSTITAKTSTCRRWPLPVS